MRARCTTAALVMLALPAALARLFAQDGTPGTDVDRKVEAHRSEFLEVEAGRGAAGAQDPLFQRASNDQCGRCHLGILNPAYRVDEPLRRKRSYVFADPALQAQFQQRFPQKRTLLAKTKLFMAHPRLDLYAAADSRHPLERFSCLHCHGGDDRRNRLRGQEFKDWNSLFVRFHPELKTVPILLPRYTQSSCRGCHDREAMVLDGAETYAQGARLLDSIGCNACHEMKDTPPETRRKTGPPLTHLRDKLDKTWVYTFLLDPESFRPTTKMPRFFRRDGDAPNSGPPFSIAEGRVLAATIVEYLYSLSSTQDPPAALVAWSADEAARANQAARGAEIVRQTGCTACHRLDEAYGEALALGTVPKHAVEFGPNLAGIGHKFEDEGLDLAKGRSWLFRWLKNPAALFPATRMPSFRLTDDEARDVTEYLLSLRISENTRTSVNHRRQEISKTSAFLSLIPLWKPTPPPIQFQDGETSIADEARPILDHLAGQFLRKDLGEAAGPARLGAMGDREKVLYLGERMVEFWGCYSCHDMKDPARTGDRDWATRAPTGLPWSVEIFPGKGLFERMPFSILTDVETDALYTYLLSHSTMGRPQGPVRAAPPREKALYAGQRLLTTYNCDSCHVLREERLLVSAAGKSEWCDGVVKFNDGKSLTVQWLADPRSLALSATQRAHPVTVPLAAVVDRWPVTGGSAHDAFKRHKTVALDIPYADLSQLLARMPPSLREAGSRTRPDWLRAFLKDPREIRPILRPREIQGRSGAQGVERNVRMPTFAFREGELDALVAAFQAGGHPEPDPPAPGFSELAAARATIKDACNKCHIAAQDGPLPPSSEAPAPPLSATAKRLRPAWLEAYLRAPLEHEAATLMPAFSPKDAAEYRDLVQALISTK